MICSSERLSFHTLKDTTEWIRSLEQAQCTSLDTIGLVKATGRASKQMVGHPSPPEPVSTPYGTRTADMGISNTNHMIVAPTTSGESLHAAGTAT